MTPASTALAPPGPLGTTWLLTARELGTKLVSPWFFGVVFAVCMIAFAYGAGFQRTFRTESLLVSTNPLLTLDITIAGFLGAALLREHGVLVAFTEYNRNVIRLEPPLIATRADVDRLIAALDAELSGGVIGLVKGFLASRR